MNHKRLMFINNIKRLLSVLLVAFLALSMFNHSVQGADSKVVSDLLSDALSQEKLDTYFDIGRGKPEIVWQDNTAFLKSGYLHAKRPINSLNYTFSVDVRAAGDDFRFRLDLGKDSAKKTFALVTIDAKQNTVILSNGSGSNETLDYGGIFSTEQWYRLSFKASGKMLYFFVNGRLTAQIQSDEGFAGVFSMRSLGDAVFLKNLSCLNTAGQVVSKNGTTVGVLEGLTPVVYPGIPQHVTFYPSVASVGNLVAEVYDAAGVMYEQNKLEGQNFSLIPRGTAGQQRIVLRDGDTIVGEAMIYLETQTTVQTDDVAFNTFFESLKNQVIKRNQPVYQLDGHTFKMHMSWLRDHIHMMEASLYWQEGYKEVLDFWLDHQHPDGFFFEMIVDAKSANLRDHDEKFYTKISDEKYILRFEIEADIEFLVVDAVYMAWQASGDSAWMRSKIPNLEKALTWIMTNPERWSKKYGLPIRGSSIDTYDFTYGHSDSNRRVVWWEKGMEWGTPMAIFHGDCTGFYQACNQLAEMYRYDGNNERASYWEDVAQKVRKNLIKTAWNGKFFAHMVQVHPTLQELPEDWQEDLSGDWNRLSYSNSCALNRDFLTQKEASSIIETFKSLRDNPPKRETVDGYADETIFAEWVTIYPSYRKKQYVKYDPGKYVNGSIAPFCAGELANGCFKWGYGEYGFDIISRLMGLYQRDGELKFFYGHDGSIYRYPADGSYGGPNAWGAAVTHNAIVEGLAGMRDKNISSNSVTISPSWTVTNFEKTYSCVSYGQNHSYLAYTSTYNKDTKNLQYQIVGDSQNVMMEILMPSGHSPKKLTLNGTELPFETVMKEDSVYAVFDYSRENNTDLDTVEVLFKTGVPKKKTEGSANQYLSLILAGIGIALLLVTGTIVYVIKKNKKK